jgi:ribosome biogenesis GTPase
VERSEIVHLGWDEEWEAVLQASGAEGEPGRLTRVERGESDVDMGTALRRAQSDSQRSQSEMAPVTGDWVTIVVDDETDVIEQILPRRTVLVRRDPGERGEEQPLSANVDVVFLVHGFDRPLRAGKLERFLVLAWNASARPVVVLAKSDLARSDEMDDLVGVIGAVAPGVEIIITSTVTGEGIDEIGRMLQPNRSGTLLGESGAGKSTLVNKLLDDDVQETQAVRSGDAKGRHTTISRDMLVLPAG